MSTFCSWWQWRIIEIRPHQTEQRKTWIKCKTPWKDSHLDDTYIRTSARCFKQMQTTHTHLTNTRQMCHILTLDTIFYALHESSPHNPPHPPSCASTMAKCTTTWINRKDFCWIHLRQYLRELRRAELKMWHSMVCWLICFIASFELLVFGGSQAFAFCIFHIVWQWSLLLLFSSTKYATRAR